MCIFVNIARINSPNKCILLTNNKQNIKTKFLLMCSENVGVIVILIVINFIRIRGTQITLFLE